MAKKGIYLTPTLSCYGIMARKPFEGFLPPDGQVKNRQVMKQGLQALKVGRFLSASYLVMLQRRLVGIGFADGVCFHRPRKKLA